jgi:hypothetical protein
MSYLLYIHILSPDDELTVLFFIVITDHELPKHALSMLFFHMRTKPLAFFATEPIKSFLSIKNKMGLQSTGH